LKDNYSRIKIPDSSINVKKGGYVAILPTNYIADERIPFLRIAELVRHRTVIVIERDEDFNLKLIRSSPNFITKVAFINLNPFLKQDMLSIVAVWNPTDNFLNINGGHAAEQVEEPGIRFDIGSDGCVYEVVGDQGVKLPYYTVLKDGQVVIEPGSKDCFDLQIKKIEGFINTYENADPLVQSTILEQTLGLLVTGFETYMRIRFGELHQEGFSLNLNELRKSLFEKNAIKFDKTIADAEQNSKGVGSYLVEKRLINFQNWRESRKAYLSGYDIDLTELGVKGSSQTMIQQVIKWRHPITHKAGDNTILNIKHLSDQKPILLSKELATNATGAFVELVENLHSHTLKA